MRNLQVSKATLAKAKFSVPAQANSFFPVGNETTHIHLGVPTTYTDGGKQKIAEEGNVFVAYVSFKRNGAFWFKLTHNDQDGYFSFPTGHQAAELPTEWQTVLRRLGIMS